MERINLFKTFLNKQQMSVTQERLEIARIATGFKEHFFTAEDIFAATGRNSFIIAKSTVYRNMKLLRSAGLIEPVLTSDRNKNLYRNIIPEKVTCRICCLDCGFEVSFNDDKFEEQVLEVCEKYEVEKYGVMVRIEGRKRFPHVHKEDKHYADTER